MSTQNTDKKAEKKKETPPGRPKKRGTGMVGKTAARLAAVQVIYQYEVQDQERQKQFEEFIAYHLDQPLIEGETLVTADEALLRAIMTVYLSRTGDIGDILKGALKAEWTMERLEWPLRALLKAGVAELLAAPETPVKIIINDFVEVARAFYAGPEPKIVNAVLDQIAKQLRH